MNFKRITTTEARALLKDKNVLLIDIRDTNSYEDSHDPASIHITQENMPDFVLNTSPQRSIIVMCYHGNSSQTIAHYLATQGFTEVYSIDGGYEEWKK